jgi:hypothetical protein
MGNMQFNLDQTFDSVNVKDSSNAADIIAAIKKVEDKVSTRFIDFWLTFLVILYSTNLI